MAGFFNVGPKVFSDGRKIQSKPVSQQENKQENESSGKLKPIIGDANTGIPLDHELIEGYLAELEKRGELNNTDKIVGTAYSPDGKTIEFKEYTHKVSNQNNNGKPVMQIHYGSSQALANKLGISYDEFQKLSFTEIQELVEQFNEQHPYQQILFP